MQYLEFPIFRRNICLRKLHLPKKINSFRRKPKIPEKGSDLISKEIIYPFSPEKSTKFPAETESEFPVNTLGISQFRKKKEEFEHFLKHSF